MGPCLPCATLDRITAPNEPAPPRAAGRGRRASCAGAVREQRGAKPPLAEMSWQSWAALRLAAPCSGQGETARVARCRAKGISLKARHSDPPRRFRPAQRTGRRAAARRTLKARGRGGPCPPRLWEGFGEATPRVVVVGHGRTPGRPPAGTQRRPGRRRSCQVAPEAARRRRRRRPAVRGVQKNALRRKRLRASTGQRACSAGRALVGFNGRPGRALRAGALVRFGGSVKASSDVMASDTRGGVSRHHPASNRRSWGILARRGNRFYSRSTGNRFICGAWRRASF